MESKDNENQEILKENTNEVENTTIEQEQVPKFTQYKEEKESKPNWFLETLKRIIVVFILLVMAVFVLKTSKYYKNDDITDRTNLIINNNNVTGKSLKADVIVENDVVFISMRDIKNFFDNYIYIENSTNKIITTYQENIAEVGFSGSYINVNGERKIVNAVAFERNDEVYLPISEMLDVYNIELAYREETDIVVIDSIKRGQIKAEASKRVSVKDYARVLSRTVDKIQKEDTVVVISKSEDGWTKVRTENGKIGFVKTSSLANEVVVRETQNDVPQIDGKINMFWDYYSEGAKAPDRTGQYIQGINVVSPAFFYINDEGEFVNKIGDSAKKYI